ncbi:MAG: T9SS type A sorting domain-containing protein, partial [Bacteroidota bacterium]|nr:T9SS type A sorting domain-containing protein [Bacteroidota bacterium]
GGQSSYYSPIETFTTAAACPDLTNLTVQTFSGNHTKAAFTWDTTGAYTYARVLIRVDTVGSSWFTAGGFGIYYPTLSVVKFGLVAGESYRASARAYCHPTISRYRSWWSPFIFWTQPGTLIRIESENSSIDNLSIYPNPSRDIFNITFTTEEKQNLKVRILNVIGEQLISEDLQQFIGEYTKQIDLSNKAKGIYFLEIETDNGVINKKLILQ